MFNEGKSFQGLKTFGFNLQIATSGHICVNVVGAHHFIISVAAIYLLKTIFKKI